MVVKSVYITEDEKELIRRIKSGDKDAYRQIVTSQCPRLYAYLYRMLGNHEDSEDILQETLSTAYNHVHQFRGDSQFSTWLYRIAINMCCKALRQRQLKHFQDKVAIKDEHGSDNEGTASVNVASKDRNALDEAIENETKQKVRMAIAGLPKKLAEVIILKELEGLNYNDISAYLAIPRGTVMSRLFRARLVLAHELRKAGLKSNER